MPTLSSRRGREASRTRTRRGRFSSSAPAYPRNPSRRRYLPRRPHRRLPRPRRRPPGYAGRPAPRSRTARRARRPAPPRVPFRRSSPRRRQSKPRLSSRVPSRRTSSLTRRSMPRRSEGRTPQWTPPRARRRCRAARGTRPRSCRPRRGICTRLRKPRRISRPFRTACRGIPGTCRCPRRPSAPCACARVGASVRRRGRQPRSPRWRPPRPFRRASSRTPVVT